jgi:hypothetical protein
LSTAKIKDFIDIPYAYVRWKELIANMEPIPQAALNIRNLRSMNLRSVRSVGGARNPEFCCSKKLEVQFGKVPPRSRYNRYFVYFQRRGLLPRFWRDGRRLAENPQQIQLSALFFSYFQISGGVDVVGGVVKNIHSEL